MFVYWNTDGSLLTEAPCLCAEEHISPTARTTHTRTLHREGLLCLRSHGEGRYVSGRYTDYPFPPLGINRKALVSEKKDLLNIQHQWLLFLWNRDLRNFRLALWFISTSRMYLICSCCPGRTWKRREVWVRPRWMSQQLFCLCGCIKTLHCVWE